MNGWDAWPWVYATAALCAVCSLIAHIAGQKSERRAIARAVAARRLKMSADGSTIVDPAIEWRYTKPPRTDRKVLLLTIGDVQTSGNWYGEIGEHFKAWHPEPKRNKATEHKLGILESTRAHRTHHRHQEHV